LYSIPAVSQLALGTLEWSYPPLEHQPEDVQAIVVLAGSVYPADAVRRQPELGEDTLYRCLKAAQYYHTGTPCLVLVSGGTVEAGGPLCAPLMGDFLIRLGVAASDVLIEDRSRTTWENAVESRKLLEQRGIRKVVLITDASHLRRAVGCFRKQGLDPVACGCRYRATSFPGKLFDFLPNPSGGKGMQVAWHEWLGLGWYWLQDRI